MISINYIYTCNVIKISKQSFTDDKIIHKNMYLRKKELVLFCQIISLQRSNPLKLNLITLYPRERLQTTDEAGVHVPLVPLDCHWFPILEDEECPWLPAALSILDHLGPPCDRQTIAILSPVRVEPSPWSNQFEQHRELSLCLLFWENLAVEKKVAEYLDRSVKFHVVVI